MKKVCEVKVWESYCKTFNVEAQDAKEAEEGKRSAPFENKRGALKRALGRFNSSLNADELTPTDALRLKGRTVAGDVVRNARERWRSCRVLL